MSIEAAERATFWKHLRNSRLLTSQQFRNAVDQFKQIETVQELSRQLIKQNLITRYQALMLQRGRSNGFFFGPYRILSELGRGGMARVYKARHETMQRLVALKVLAPHLIKTDRAQQFFKREVQTASLLRHANIILAYDAGQLEGRHYLAMEYIEGATLDQIVRKQGPLPVGLACEIVRQTAVGLHYAHQQGVVHRDIKPANLLLEKRAEAANREGFVKILDFGLSRLHRPEEHRTGTILSVNNTVLGTPDYLSPEQARDLHQTDFRSDIYSLGCTFYFLLTGQVPFPGGKVLEKLLRHGSEEPSPMRDLRPEVPTSLVEIISRMMAKQPADRYPSAEALAQSLTEHAAPCPAWEPQATLEPEPILEPIENKEIDTSPEAWIDTAIDTPEVKKSGGRRPSGKLLIGATIMILAVLAGILAVVLR